MGKGFWRQAIAILAVVIVFNYLFVKFGPNQPEPVVDISYSRFKTELAGDNIEQVVFQGEELSGRFRERVVISTGAPPAKEVLYQEFRTNLPPVDDPGLLQSLKNVRWRSGLSLPRSRLSGRRHFFISSPGC
jgi:cell division protease FtsH